MLVYNPNDNLSKHFKMREVAKSPIADRLLIDNTPNAVVLDRAKTLAEKILEPIRVHFGIAFSPNSWYRGEELERAINEKAYQSWCARKGLPVNDNSWKQYFDLKSHPRGEAADIEIIGVDNDALYAWVKANLEYDQLIREFPKPNDPQSGWVHVSYRAGNNRKQDFTIG